MLLLKYLYDPDNFNPKSTSNLSQISIILDGIIIFDTPLPSKSSDDSISVSVCWFNDWNVVDEEVDLKFH